MARSLHALALLALSGCPAPALDLTDGDGDGVVGVADCDPARADVSPNAAERCDGVDNDCDGEVDEGLLLTLFLDEDGDGVGAEARLSCALVPGLSTRSGDCDDHSDTRFPGQDEVCNGVDDDCDGAVDEDAVDAVEGFSDLDGDGYGEAPIRACPDASAPAGGDCDDTDGDRHPGAPEVCDGVDNDCDGEVDEGLLRPLYEDRDGDGFGALPLAACGPAQGLALVGGDCDDADERVSPAAGEVCDGVDNDCDGAVDEGVSARYFVDADGDGFGGTPTQACALTAHLSEVPGDCDDGDAEVFPGCLLEEYPGDEVDDNCDGSLACVDFTCDSYPELVLGGRSFPGQAPTQASLFYGPDFGDDRVGLDAVELSDILSADLDGDRLSDLVLVQQGAGLPTLVLSGNGARPGQALPLPTEGAVRARIADLNEDGFPDLVVAEAKSSSGSYHTRSHVFWGGPDGLSAESFASFPTHGASDVEVADVDGDGSLDLIFTGYFDGDLDETATVIYQRGPDGYPTLPSQTLLMSGCLDVDVVDLDGDGLPELITANLAEGRLMSQADYTTSSWVWWGSAAGYSEAARDRFHTSAVSEVLVADLNGDGYLDLVYAQQDYGLVHVPESLVFWGSYAGYSELDRSALPSLSPKDTLAADLDGDGLPELVMCNHHQPGSFLVDSYVYWSDAAGFSAERRTALPTVGCVDVEAADLDMDGDLDLVFANARADEDAAPIASMIFWNEEGAFGADLTTVLPQRAWVARAIPGAGDRVAD